MNLSPKAKGTLAVVIAMTAFVLLWQKYYAFLNQGRSAPESAQILNRIEKEGVPDFSLRTIDGKSVSLSDFRGKIAIVNFWASWCEPCVEEFPSLLKLLEQFKGQIVMLAVSGDYEEKDIHTFLKAFRAKNPNLYVMWDKDLEVAKKYGTFKLPESYIVGKDGRLIRKITGVQDWAAPHAIEFFKDLVAR